MSEANSMIFFRSGSMSLLHAKHLLSERGLTVKEAGDELKVRWGEGPELSVRWCGASHVAAEACEICRGTPFDAEMKQCDNRFEIDIDDLDVALDEINTLVDVQITLQDATHGYLFNSWNRELQGPAKAV